MANEVILNEVKDEARVESGDLLMPDERQRRADALERLERLRHRVSTRNQDLTDEQVEAFAKELGHEALARLIARGEVSFERDRS